MKPTFDRQGNIHRRQCNHGTITARDNYKFTRNISKCVSVERLCKDINMQISFNADEINLIYQFGEKSKAETCANLSYVSYRKPRAVSTKQREQARQMMNERYRAKEV